MQRIAGVIRAAAQAAHINRRPEQAWRAMAAIVAFVSLWQGFGYAIGGRGFTQSDGWKPLLAVVGSMHTHGVIMLLLGFGLAVQISGGYTVHLLWTLRLLRTYSLIVSACWFGSWIHYGITWGAPGWWLALAALSTWLAWFPPPARQADGVR